MPGIKHLLGDWNESSGKNKLADFANEYWHYEKVRKAVHYKLHKVCKKEWIPPEPRQSNSKIYLLAKSGIPTISSGTPSTKMLVQEAVKVLERVVNKAWVHVAIFDKNQQC